MSAFLRFVQKKHSYVSWQQDGEQKDKEPKTSQSLLQVSKVGVFSCGPRAVTRANSRACEQVIIIIIMIIIIVNFIIVMMIVTMIVVSAVIGTINTVTLQCAEELLRF